VSIICVKANASNPSRFENRGGKLLKEEKARKAIEKELPKVEKELESNLLQWENDWERHFIINDTRYIDTVTGQRNEREKKKNDEIQKRVCYTFIICLSIVMATQIAKDKKGDNNG